MSSRAAWKGYVLPGATFLALVVVLVPVWARVHRHRRDLVEIETGVTAGQVARRLEVYLSTRLALVDHMRAEWLRGHVDSPEPFLIAATGIQEEFGGFQAINWIDPQGVIRWVVPEESNRPARGWDLHDHPYAAETFILAERTREPHLTPPVALLQGGRGFASYFPIVRDGRLEGYVNGVFRTDPLVEDCLEKGVDPYFAFSIRDGETTIYQRGAGGSIVRSADLEVLNRVWSVDLYPTAGLMERAGSRADDVLLALGVLVSGILAWMIGLVRSRERSLRASERRTRSLVETAAGVLVVLDRDGRILEFNREAERVLGARKGDVIGRDYVEEFTPEGARDLVRADLARVMAGAETRGFDNPVRARDGTGRVLLWNATRVVDDDGGAAGVLAVGQDITDRQAAEAERRRLEDRMRESQRLESLGLMAGMIAHDFNNLLTGILGNVGLALLKTRPESPVRGVLGRIESAAQRSADLTNQLLAYSGRGRFVVEPVDLSRLVEEMSHLLEAVVSKKAVVRYDFARDQPAVEGDPTQIRQVVMNLITNASDAVSERGGVITIATRTQDVEPGYFEGSPLHEQLPAGRYVCLEVSDNGVGMDPETIGRIFDPFFTTKAKGRGLGLAAVQGIVRGHRGAIRVYSEPGRGTSFKILLPASAKEAAPAPAEERVRTAWRGSGTVLVIDDAEPVVEVARDTLADRGFEVLVARDGREGLRIFAEGRDAIRLVLLDVTLPDLTGGEVFREIRRLSPEVPILLSSGYSEADVSGPFAGRPISGFIQKPYSPATLLAWVEGILGE